MKREDLSDQHIGGNKWRKLKYNLELARQQHKSTLLTFGGAWSNHIYATAAAGEYFGFRTIGIIRGEAREKPNPTLQFAQDRGMQLVYIDRHSYRNKNTAEYIDTLHQRFGDFYLLPEGGSNATALKGCAEIVTDINMPFDVISVACGTGATLAGLVSALNNEQHAIGFAVLKGADFLRHDITDMLAACGRQTARNWLIELDYHFGGYAKTTPELFAFIRQFKTDFGITLDAVYTGKMFYGLFDRIGKGMFDKGTCIVAIHSGGLQGNAGFPQLDTL